MSIYVVYGESGEYSDWTQWNIKAFTDRERADQWVKNANEWIKTHLCPAYKCKHTVKEVSPFDPQTRCNTSPYSIPSYDVEELELE